MLIAKLKLLVKVLFAIIIFHYYRVINRAHSFLAELQSGYRNYHLYNRQIKKFPTEKQNVSLKHILT